VRLDLPAPPVPVMPIPGARRCVRVPDLRSVSRRPRHLADLERGDRPCDLLVVARTERRTRMPPRRGRDARAPHDVGDHAVEAGLRPSSRVDALDA